MSRELPKIFCAEQIKAIQAGRMTQFREVIDLPPYSKWEFTGKKPDGFGRFKFKHESDSSSGFCFMKPRYQLGDLLWVKEVWSVFDVNAVETAIAYFADPDDALVRWFSNKVHSIKGKYRLTQWRSARSMPKEYVRLWLRVSAVKEPQRIKDISEKDAIAEAIDATGCCQCSMDDYEEGVRFCGKCNKPFLDVDVEFVLLWNRLHPKPGERFEDNPWVHPYIFERIQK